MSAALQTYNQNQDTLFVPDGGIAAFLYATEGDWATEDDIPETGIAQVKSVADKLAEYGRRRRVHGHAAGAKQLFL